MNISQLKIIGLIAMILDHIAYFFPNISCALLFHYIGRIAAPIFVFCVVNAIFNTSLRIKYLKRLYIASVGMAVVQMITQVELNFLRTLFVMACIISILQLKKENNTEYKKYVTIYTIYQIVSYIICAICAATSSAASETFCFYLLPAILGSVMTLEGGILWVVLGIILYYSYNNKRLTAIYYIIYVSIYEVCFASDIIITILIKIRKIIPYIGYGLTECLQYILETVIGISPMNIGGDLFSENYYFMMIGALPMILSYNGKKGYNIKYFFYIFYILHILILWFISQKIIF